MNRPVPAARRTALLLGLACAVGACEPMESGGDPFAPAKPASAPVPAPPAAAAATASDPAFDFPAEPPLVLTSEQLAGGELGSAMAEAAGVDPASVAAEPPAAPPAAPPPPPPTGLPAAAQWPVRLVSTLPQAQPPRAILGLASGEERVVSPGSILAEEGLVVMAVSADRVQLAKVEPAGDHATIRTIELSAQYPAN